MSHLAGNETANPGAPGIGRGSGECELIKLGEMSPLLLDVGLLFVLGLPRASATEFLNIADCMFKFSSSRFGAEEVVGTWDKWLDKSKPLGGFFPGSSPCLPNNGGGGGGVNGLLALEVSGATSGVS